MALNEIDGWPQIQLAWRQKMAAFWSICWPSTVVSLVVVVALTSAFSFDRLTLEIPGVNLAGSLLSLLGQAVFVRRLMKKKYRTFRVEVLRDGVLSNSFLSVTETAQFAFKVIWPQVVIFALGILVQALLSGNSRASRLVGSFFYLIRFFVAGPYAISFALNSEYPTFRVQTYGQRYI